MSLSVVRTVADTRALLDPLVKRGSRVALVPTMGFLHEGHATLMREAKARADVVVVSIFVNPTQFGPKEDLASYPRDEAGDVTRCEREGVTAVFAPSAAEMYPPGFGASIDAGPVAHGLDGARRPGHFSGVATVVAKLFGIVRPHVALFGEKDFQQLQVVRALTRDLNLGVEIVGIPTVREPDGLAMSSRNSYLNADERTAARALSRGLFAAQALASRGPVAADALVQVVRQALAEVQAKEDEIALVHAITLEPLRAVQPSVPARLLVAAFVGKTRLIDNVPVG